MDETLSPRPEKHDAGRDDPMLVCPRCDTRLRELKCKLVCDKCGYYMSCADYY